VTSLAYHLLTTSLHFVAPYTPPHHSSTHTAPFSAPRRENAPRAGRVCSQPADPLSGQARNPAAKRQ